MLSTIACDRRDKTRQPAIMQVSRDVPLPIRRGLTKLLITPVFHNRLRSQYHACYGQCCRHFAGIPPLSTRTQSRTNTKQYTTSVHNIPHSNTILPLPNTFNTNTANIYHKLKRLYQTGSSANHIANACLYSWEDYVSSFPYYDNTYSYHYLFKHSRTPFA